MPKIWLSDGDRQPLWPPKIQQVWKGSCRDPGASGVERKIAQGDYRWMKNETWKWRMIALSLSLSLPSSNLLVLCHVIKLLKGQTLHHTNLFPWLFLTQSLALSFFFMLYIDSHMIENFWVKLVSKLLDGWKDGWMDLIICPWDKSLLE